MGILSELNPMSALAEGGVKGLGDAAIGVGTFLKDIRTAITGEAPIDADKKAELLAQSYQAEVNLAIAQLDVNKAEATSPSLFKGGWRPFIGWICGVGLMYEFLLRPLLPWTFSLLTAKALAAMPSIDSMALMNLVFGMLGLGALRTVEKIKGIS